MNSSISYIPDKIGITRNGIFLKIIWVGLNAAKHPANANDVHAPVVLGVIIDMPNFSFLYYSYK